MKSRKETGAIGEGIACAYLESKGFVIKHRNLYIGHLETDIVCEDDEHIVFAEVKTRRESASSRYGSARDAVDAGKISKLKNVVYMYMRSNSSKKIPRIDVIEVYIREGKLPLVKHIKNILG